MKSVFIVMSTGVEYDDTSSTAEVATDTAEKAAVLCRELQELNAAHNFSLEKISAFRSTWFEQHSLSHPDKSDYPAKDLLTDEQQQLKTRFEDGILSYQTQLAARHEKYLAEVALFVQQEELVVPDNYAFQSACRTVYCVEEVSFKI